MATKQIVGSITKIQPHQIEFTDIDGNVITFDDLNELPSHSQMLTYKLLCDDECRVIDILDVTKKKTTKKQNFGLLELSPKHLQLLKYFNQRFILQSTPQELDRYYSIIEEGKSPWRFCFLKDVIPEFTGQFWPSSSTEKNGRRRRSFQKFIPFFTLCDMEIAFKDIKDVPSQQVLDVYYKYYKQLKYTGNIFYDLSSVGMTTKKKRKIDGDDDDYEIEEVYSYLIDKGIFGTSSKNIIIDKELLRQYNFITCHDITIYQYTNLTAEMPIVSENSIYYSTREEFATEFFGVKFENPSSSSSPPPPRCRLDKGDIVIENYHKTSLKIMATIFKRHGNSHKYFLMGNPDEASIKTGNIISKEAIPRILSSSSSSSSENIVITCSKQNIFDTIRQDFAIKCRNHIHLPSRLIFYTDYLNIGIHIEKQIDSINETSNIDGFRLGQTICLDERGIYGKLTNILGKSGRLYSSSGHYMPSIVMDSKNTYHLTPYESISRGDVIDIKSYSGCPKTFVYYVIPFNHGIKLQENFPQNYGKVIIVKVFV